MDVATGLSVGTLIGTVAIVFTGASPMVVSLMVIGLGTIGGVIGYFWQSHYQI